MSHGLLLVGGDKESVKNSLIEFLEGTENIADNSSPLIDAEFFESSTNESLGIDTARRLKEFLSHKPVRAIIKTAVVADGDVLTHEAQNALLKICEDPPTNSRIILIVKNEENILPTLRSRFQKIYLSDGELSKNSRIQIPAQILKLAEQFLKSDSRARDEIIKLVIGKDSQKNRKSDQSTAGEEDNTLVFLDALIFLLRKDPVKHAAFLGAILRQKARISTLSLNRRLQLAFLSSLWYNS